MLTYIAKLVLMAAVLHAGMFPVLPGEPVFPFSGKNSITPDFPPFDQPGILDTACFVDFLANFQNYHPGKLVQAAFSDWLSQGDLLSRIQFPEVSIALYQLESISMVPGLESVKIIFPFHEFW
ncbi:MAG: hypothetical protein V2I46_08480 [Bacteroides sp.]|nr:hypothetical protein [Bacteroides sp.]